MPLELGPAHHRHLHARPAARCYRPGIARIPPIWPNLPAGHLRVASGTLLAVIRLIVLLTATLAAPPAATVPAPAPPAP
ncbi:MAG TPA: hypothetical protein VJ735_05070, partial [Actinomycetes bacterium]|nr:hypothetical protein [Actinomycetes bacterium]